MEDYYVFGHKNPDVDSICSAIVYAKISCKHFVPARLGEINEETSYILNYFKVPTPKLLNSAEGKTVVLVDHNEFQQSANGIEKAEILEIIDHHKINFSYDKPIKFLTEPLGSTATIIAREYSNEINLSGNKKALAGLLLSAILSDTVIFKSPTTTEDDKLVARGLAEDAGIRDVIKLGRDIKKAKSSLKGKTIESIIMSDFKDFDFNGKKVGIGQSEVVDINEIYERKGDILEFLENLKNKGYEITIFMATDIIMEGSELFFAGDRDKIEKAFNIKVVGNSTYIPRLMSRKKQVVPILQHVL